MADSFLNIKVTLSEKETYEKSLDEDLFIDKNSLDKELVSQAAKFAWWSTLSCLARDRVQRLKQEIEIYEAQACQAVRAEKAKSGEKITEGGMWEIVRMLPDWQKRKSDLLEAQKQADVLDTARESFDHRKYMLRALSAEAGRPVDLSVMKAIAEETLRSSK